jgi:RHS repeat-associated protein
MLHTSTFEYDVLNRQTRKTDVLGRSFTYGYDPVGNQTSIVDANANAASNPALGSTSLVYDSLSRVVLKTYSDGTASVSYVYDGAGRRASMTDGTGTSTYTYDAGNRVTEIIKGGDVWAYGYDQAGNVTSRTLPGGVSTTATFDDAGQQTTLVDLTGGPAKTSTYGYDLAGNRTGMLFPNGVTQSRSFDRAARLTTIINTGPSGLIGGFVYTRDANGNPTAVDVSGPAGAIATESTRNTYDNADRLTKTCFTATTCTAANQTVWTFDKVGNRLTERVGAAAVSTYTYDAADQLTAVTGPGAAAFTYNANGDMTTVGGDTYTYNTARQPTGSTIGGVTTTFTYDGNGNRTSRTRSGVASFEVVDPNSSLPVLVAERDATGTVLRRYSHDGLTPSRFEDATANTSGYYLTDGLGSVTNIIDPTGIVGATYRYSPYGAARTSSTVSAATGANPLKYTGQQQDATGLYNLRARHYNPSSGRFTQTDPMPYGAGNSFEGAYVYGLNNPVMYTDPSGLRGQLAGCALKNNPIQSRAPGMLAIRSLVLFPVPRTPPPITVPPRTLPPRTAPGTTKPPGTTTTTLPDEPTTTTALPATTTAAPTTTKLQSCEREFAQCMSEADFWYDQGSGSCSFHCYPGDRVLPWSKTCYRICMDGVRKSYLKAVSVCSRRFEQCRGKK